MKALVLGALLLAVAHASAQTRELHGAGDSFAGDGVSIVWGILRGASEELTEVRLRVLADPARYTHFEIVGINPFSKDEALHLASRITTGANSVAISRARFGQLPRTEVRFFSSEQDAATGKPALSIFYLGVPDTTPEFDSESRLKRHLEGERK